MISINIQNKLKNIPEIKYGATQHIDSVFNISGGSINDAYKIQSASGSFFLKINEAAKYPGMFETEAKGLSILEETSCIGIPCVIATGQEQEEQFILMEFIHSGKPRTDFHFEFGKSLAKLHKNSSTHFGLDHDNFIGSLPQRNKQHTNWTDFFINERIEPMVKMAIDSGAASKHLAPKTEKLFGKLPEIFPVEAPALLHGDLWSGNYMCGLENKSWIFDPAVYYGHREMDIAMTRLFGGFSDDFYNGYVDEFPLEKGWEQRVDIFNLYPLLVHVNLFGGHYVFDVERILERF